MMMEVLDGNCVGGIWCASARVDGINFQGRSFNHSDISPFLESTNYERPAEDYRTRRPASSADAITFVVSD
jgi:hypothetical protein